MKKWRKYLRQRVFLEPARDVSEISLALDMASLPPWRVVYFITSEEQYAAERAALEAWTAVNIDVAYRELVLNTQKSRARRLLSTLSGARVARGL